MKKRTPASAAVKSGVSLRYTLLLTAADAGVR